jgi:hypothetical protein
MDPIKASVAIGTNQLSLFDSLYATTAEAGTRGLVDVKSTTTSNIKLLNVRGQRAGRARDRCFILTEVEH